MESRDAGRTRLLAVTISTFALSLGSVSTATAAPNDVVYDALGDSYAAGAGASPGHAYPVLVDGRMKIALDDFVAVPGATVPTMMSQLGALGDETGLVTVSIGGNDIGWGTVVGACLMYPDQVCAGAVGQASQAITGVLPWLLDGAYGSVHGSAPDAYVVVTGYPRLFSPEYGDYVVPGTPHVVTVAEQQLMNDAADLLNATIAAKAGAYGFQFVDVTGMFTGHGVNSPDAWITGLSSPVPFHPNDAGQEAYAAAVTSQVNPRSLR